jgi:predicted ArsR family transcriptional regulator
MTTYQTMGPDAPVLRATLQTLKGCGPMTIMDLAEVMGIKLKTAKMRLHIMKSHGMVENKPSTGGRKVWYAVGYGEEASSAIVQAASVWHYAQRCAA